jgi:hypothetical protein
MPKPPSQTVAAKLKTKPMPSQAQVEALARDLVDKPYGEAQQNTVAKKAKPLTISLPPALIEQLEDRARENKRKGDGPKTVSALVREALGLHGFMI